MSSLPTDRWDRLLKLVRNPAEIRFDEYMEFALYDFEIGYYARRADQAGREGDFITSVEVSPLFGACIARFLHDEWVRLGKGPLDVIELGAGRGTLSRAILDGSTDEDFGSALQFHLVERSEPARRRHADLAPTRFASYADATELPKAFTHAVLIANELFDNLPVRRVVLERGGWKEIVVRVAVDGSLREGRIEASPELHRLIESHHVRPGPGQNAEVCPSAVPLLEDMLGRIGRGGFLIFDYGDEADRLYGDVHPEGTLATYRAHGNARGVYEDVGEQDITAHVNFTVLREAAERLGFSARFTTQSTFLYEHGLPELVAATIRGPVDDLSKLRATQAARILSHPEAMGERFRVLSGRRE